MTSKELKQLLVRQLPQLRKPWFKDDPIHAYDRKITDDISYIEMNHFVQNAVDKLRSEGLDISTDYEEDRADCDNWARWIQAEVSKAWATSGKPNTGALAFGFEVNPGHAINIGICHGKVYMWNYGQPCQPCDVSQDITLVDFY